MIPGFLISILTFPGVIVHEIAHVLFCRMFRVAIFDVCYFRFGNPAGFVVHEKPRNHIHHLLIGIGPFFVNSIVGALIASPAVIPVIKFEAGNPLQYVLIWLGVSIAMHAFPSTGDAASIWEAVKGSDVPALVKVVAYPVVGIIYLGALGSMFWLDALYGIAIAGVLPNLLISLFVK